MQTWPELSPRGRSAGAGPTGRSPPLRSLRQPADRWSRRRPETSAPVTVRGCMVQSFDMHRTQPPNRPNIRSLLWKTKLHFLLLNFPSVVSDSNTRCRWHSFQTQHHGAGAAGIDLTANTTQKKNNLIIHKDWIPLFVSLGLPDMQAGAVSSNPPKSQHHVQPMVVLHVKNLLTRTGQCKNTSCPIIPTGSGLRWRVIDNTTTVLQIRWLAACFPSCVQSETMKCNKHSWIQSCQLAIQPALLL